MVSNTTFTSLLADDQLWSTDLFLITGLLIMYAVTGSLGNILIIIVYCRKTDQRNTSIFIKLLAVIDATVCLFVIPYTVVFLMHLIRQDFMCQLFEFIRHFSIITSNFTLVAVAAERFIAVCRPTRRLTIRTVKIFIILITVMSVLLSLPPLGLYAVVEDGTYNNISPQFGTTPYFSNSVRTQHKYDYCQFTSSILGSDLTLAYHVILAVIFIGTVISITVLYSIIYGVLWKRSRLRRGLRFNETSIVLSKQRKCSLRGTMTGDETDNIMCSNEANLEEHTLKHGDNEHISEENGSPEKLHQLSAKNISHQSQIPAINKNSDSNIRSRSDSMYLRRRPGRYRCHRTAKMLFLCTLIYLFTWIPYWLDTFDATDILILKYLFFLGNATNPIIYGIVNQNVRKQIWKLIG